jgi:hypothetical protein
LLELPTISGFPATARKVGSQSWPVTNPRLTRLPHPNRPIPQNQQRVEAQASALVPKPSSSTRERRRLVVRPTTTSARRFTWRRCCSWLAWEGILGIGVLRYGLDAVSMIILAVAVAILATSPQPPKEWTNCDLSSPRRRRERGLTNGLFRTAATNIFAWGSSVVVEISGLRLPPRLVGEFQHDVC